MRMENMFYSNLNRMAMRFLIFMILCLVPAMADAGVRTEGRLSRLDARVRDSVMVARVQHLMMTKRPWLYRREVRPVVKRWVMDDPAVAGKEREPYIWLVDKAVKVRKGDVCYAVTLYYWNWMEEGFTEDYTARGIFLDRTGELLTLWDGWGYGWSDPDGMTDQRRLSLMPVAARDSVLAAVSADVLKRLLPRFYYYGARVTDVREETFEKLKYPWLGDDVADLHTANPADRYGIFYVVTLTGERPCGEDGQRKPYRMEVYVAEKEEMPYKTVDAVNNRVYTLMESAVLDEMERRLPTVDNGCREWIRKQRVAIDCFRDVEFAR